MTHCRDKPKLCLGPALTKASRESPGMLHGQLGRQTDSALT